MIECDICLTKIKKQYRKKHEKMKKHNFFCSNLIINRYIVNKDVFDNLKDIFKSH